MRRCHYLWRGPMYVKHDGRVFPCCQSYMLDGAPVGDLRSQIAGGDFQLGCHAGFAAACTRKGEARRSICARAAARRFRIRCWWPEACCCMANGCAALCRLVERLIYGRKLPKQLLTPPRPELVQIHKD